MAEQNPEKNNARQERKLMNPTNITGAGDKQDIDPAMKSLSDALRVSFRLLSFIMILFVVLFLATGIEFIQPQLKFFTLFFYTLLKLFPSLF